MSKAIETQGLVAQDRLREVVRILREGTPKGITRHQLSQKLGGVSTRTVDRAIKLLEEQGARIRRQREGQHAEILFHLDRGPSWDEHVSTTARLALQVAEMTLSHSGTSLWDNQLTVLEKIASSNMSSGDQRLFDQLKCCIRVIGGIEESHEPIEPGQVLKPILDALRDGRELEVDYQSAGAGEPRSLTVVPYGLTHDLYSGGAFLLAWEPLRKTALQLRLSRMFGAKVTRKPGVIPDPERLAQAARYQVGGWMSLDPPFEVVIRIHGTNWVEALTEAPPNLPDFWIQKEKGGRTALVRFKANHRFGPARWILQFGEQAQILEPQDLRDYIGDRLKQAAAVYENPSS